MSGHKTVHDYVSTCRSMTADAFGGRHPSPFLFGREVLEEEFQDDDEEEMDVEEEERHEVDEEEGQSNVPRRGRDRLPSHNTEIMSRFVSGGTGKVAV
jgi:hypothetical protein